MVKKMVMHTSPMPTLVVMKPRSDCSPGQQGRKRAGQVEGGVWYAVCVCWVSAAAVPGLWCGECLTRVCQGART